MNLLEVRSRPHLRFAPCQALSALKVVEVFRHRNFLEVVVEVFRHRNFLEVEVEVFRHRNFLEVVEGAPFLPQVAAVVEGAPFLPQVAAVVAAAVVLRLQDLLEEVSVQSSCAPNWLVGVGK